MFKYTAEKRNIYRLTLAGLIYGLLRCGYCRKVFNFQIFGTFGNSVDLRPYCFIGKQKIF